MDSVVPGKSSLQAERRLWYNRPSGAERKKIKAYSADHADKRCQVSEKDFEFFQKEKS